MFSTLCHAITNPENLSGAYARLFMHKVCLQSDLGTAVVVKMTEISLAGCHGNAAYYIWY